MRVAVLAITKNGIQIGVRLAELFPSFRVYAPKKLHTDAANVEWYEDSTRARLAELFCSYDGIVCVFSLGAVVRLVAPLLVDKKSDPAILVIDDLMSFVISVLSGHIGGANSLAMDVAKKTGALPVITTAADVNRTIAVDMVGREQGWVIDDDSTVTAVSAHMVNGESIGVFQDAGDRDWWDGPLPHNVTTYDTLESMTASASRAFLVMSDRSVPDDIRQRSVVYRPPSLVVGIGVHQSTTSDTIKAGLDTCLRRHGLSPLSVYKLASLHRPRPVEGLIRAAKDLGVDVEYVDRDKLAEVNTPNPSKVVENFEGTASVSEAAALLVSGGTLVVPKQKFPPDLTVAVARAP